MFTPTDPTLAKVVTVWSEIVLNTTWGYLDIDLDLELELELDLELDLELELELELDLELDL